MAKGYVSCPHAVPLRPTTDCPRCCGVEAAVEGPCCGDAAQAGYAPGSHGGPPCRSAHASRSPPPGRVYGVGQRRQTGCQWKHSSRCSQGVHACRCVVFV
eukprot:1063066-Pelagomonas_calceolata.AAC.13